MGLGGGNGVVGDGVRVNSRCFSCWRYVWFEVNLRGMILVMTRLNQRLLGLILMSLYRFMLNGSKLDRLRSWILNWLFIDSNLFNFSRLNRSKILYGSDWFNRSCVVEGNGWMGCIISVLYRSVVIGKDNRTIDLFTKNRFWTVFSYVSWLNLLNMSISVIAIESPWISNNLWDIIFIFVVHIAAEIFF